MLPISSALAGTEAEVRWSVLVAFNNPEARRRAMKVCDSMVARFWPEMEFQVHWCSFDQLGRTTTAKEAVKHAAAAHIVIIATEAATGVPGTVKAWMNEWCSQRAGREGALIGLVEGSPESPAHMRIQQLLRNAAHQAGLDYLTQEPAYAPVPIPDEAGWLDAKADQMGSVLGGILDQPVHPSGGN